MSCGPKCTKTRDLEHLSRLRIKDKINLKILTFLIHCKVLKVKCYFEYSKIKGLRFTVQRVFSAAWNFRSLDPWRYQIIFCISSLYNYNRLQKIIWNIVCTLDCISWHSQMNFIQVLEIHHRHMQNDLLNFGTKISSNNTKKKKKF